MNAIRHVKSVCLALLLGLGAHLSAQPNLDMETYSKKYPDSRGVMLENTRSAKLSVKNNKLQIDTKEIISYFILTDKPQYFSEGEIYFSEQMKINTFEAYSLIPEGKKYKKVKVDSFQDKFENDDNIFYDENKKRSFVFPSLVQGAKIYQEHSMIITEPRFFGKYYFESFLPVENSVFELTAPSDIEFTAYKLGNHTEEIQYTQVKEGKNIVHRWAMKNLKPLLNQEDAMPIGYYSPHLVIVVNRFKNNEGKTIDIAPDLQALFNWYSSLLTKVDMSVSPEMKQITDSITRNKSSELEKLKSIYYWVQDNIKYIAFEHGMEGIIPRDPSKILAKRYGDCKDMSMLIHTMAKYAGIKTSPTWIGTRDIPYRYDQFPSMHVDNHMIVTYLDSLKKPYFLDGTSEFLNINYPSAFIQGKQALAYLSESEYKLFMVPEVAPSQNFVRDSIHLKIVNDSLIGEGVIRMTGFIQQRMIRMVNGVSGEDLMETLSGITKKGNNKYKLDTAYFDPINRDSAFVIHYRFVIKDYIVMNNDEVFVNLNLDKDLKNTKIDLTQSPYPIFQQMKLSWKSTFDLTIPAGYEVEFLPQNFSMGNNLLKVDGEYSKSATSILLSNFGMINYLELPTNEFENYNATIKKVNQAYNQSIILKKIKK